MLNIRECSKVYKIGSIVYSACGEQILFQGKLMDWLFRCGASYAGRDGHCEKMHVHRDGTGTDDRRCVSCSGA